MFNPDVRNLTLKQTPIWGVKFVVWSLPLRSPESLTHRIDDSEVCETWLQEGRWCIRARSKLSKSYVLQNSSHNLVKKPVAKLRFVARLERAAAQQVVHQQPFSFINAFKKDKRLGRISLITNHPVVDIHICETVA